MKQIIRNQTFETNSSSMHSLCLLNTNNEVQDIKNISVDLGGRGINNKELTTTYEILSYFWTLVNELEVDNKYRKLLLEWFPDIDFEQPKEIGEWDEGKFYDIDGYVDHGNEWEEHLDEIFDNKERFLDILFNGYMCLTNDNSGSIYKSNDSMEYVETFVPKNTKEYWIKGN